MRLLSRSRHVGTWCVGPWCVGSWRVSTVAGLVVDHAGIRVEDGKGVQTSAGGGVLCLRAVSGLEVIEGGSGDLHGCEDAVELGARMRCRLAKVRISGHWLLQTACLKANANSGHSHSLPPFTAQGKGSSRSLHSRRTKTTKTTTAGRVAHCVPLTAGPPRRDGDATVSGCRSELHRMILGQSKYVCSLLCQRAIHSCLSLVSASHGWL